MKRLLLSLVLTYSAFGAVIKPDVVNKKDEKILYHACKHEDIETVKSYINNMGKTFFKLYGRKFIDCSILNYDITLTNYLISKAKRLKFNIDFSDDEGGFLLIEACKKNRLDFIKILISNGADVNFRVRRRTPLHVAYFIEKGFSLSIIKYLINSGANIDVIRFSPLHAAVITGDKVQVQSLIANGANVNDQDQSGWTPLNWACRYRYLDIIKILLNNGANPGIPDYKGNFAAYDACLYLYGDICLNVVKLLIGHGFNVNQVNDDGCNIFHMACKFQRSFLLRFLVQEYPHLIKTRTMGGFSGFEHMPLFFITRILYGSNVEDKFIPKKIRSDLRDRLSFIFSISRPKGYSICQLLELIKKDLISIIKSNDIKKIRKIRNLNTFFSEQEISSFLLEKIESLDYNEDVVIELMKKVYMDYNLLFIKDNKGNNLLYQAMFHGRINLSLFLIYLKKSLINDIKWNSFCINSMCQILHEINRKSVESFNKISAGIYKKVKDSKEQKNK